MKSLSAALCGLTLAAGPALADTVQMQNGDTVSGSVVSMDDQSLRLRSETLGDIAVPRAKIAAVYLGEGRVGPAPVPTAESAAPAIAGGPMTAEQQRLNDIVGQLKQSGVPSGDMKSLQNQFPLLATPEVQDFFNDRVGGLTTGRLDVSDIRDDAVKALGMIDELEADLGPDGAAALRGYKGILEHFVRQADAEATPPSSAPPASGSK